jgi:zinc transport system substrate-binding protein
MQRITLAALVAALLASGCTAGSDRRTVVASFYPLAFAAERIAGPGWEVIDLTPPGAEAHDVELSAEDRAALERADVVVYLGNIGFQPQVEDALSEGSGRVVALADQLLHSPDGNVPPGADPHLWLDPGAMVTTASLISNALSAEDAGGRLDYRRRADALRRELRVLEERYGRVLNLSRCEHRTVVASHEAFNYMVGRYGFDQFGLSGLTPEGEPTHDRLVEARRLIEEGKAGAVFYEQGEDSERIARSVADDAGVPALPLSTLESQPAEGDYLTVMRDNLKSLREGLGCR